VSDFDEGGGTLLLNGVQLAYKTVNNTTQTITLTAPLAAAAVAGDPLQAIIDGQPAVEWIANVSVDEGDTIAAGIPTALVSYFPEGTYADQAQVEIDIVGDDYRVIAQPNVTPSFDGAVVWNPRVTGTRAGVSIPNATWTPLNTWTITEAEGITVGSGFTVVYPGTYLALSRASFTSQSTGRRGVRVMVNGTEVSPFLVAADSGGQTFVQTVASIRLAELDLVTFEVYQGSGGSLALGVAIVSLYRISI
jgi:hypothetical protein